MAKVTEIGQQKMVDLLDSATRASVGTFNRIAWGSSGTLETTNDTALGVEHPETRATGTQTQPTSVQYQVAGTLTATGNREIREVGLFDATTAGNMFLRHTFSVINVETSDQITFTLITTVKDSSE